MLSFEVYYILYASYIADDFRDEPLEVYFKSTETLKTLFVKTTEDDVFEPNENFAIFLQVLDDYQRLGVDIDSDNNEAIITIINDDGKICLTCFNVLNNFLL